MKTNPLGRIVGVIKDIGGWMITKEEIHVSVAEAMNRHALPVENSDKDCEFNVWTRGGCRQRVTHQVNGKPYCSEHARIKAIYLNSKS